MLTLIDLCFALLNVRIGVGYQTLDLINSVKGSCSWLCLVHYSVVISVLSIRQCDHFSLHNALYDWAALIAALPVSMILFVLTVTLTADLSTATVVAVRCDFFQATLQLIVFLLSMLDLFSCST